MEMNDFFNDDEEKEDEDPMIDALKRHKNLKLMVKNIAKSEGIQIRSTKKNDKNGDIAFLSKDKDKLIEALNKKLKKER